MEETFLSKQPRCSIIYGIKVNLITVSTPAYNSANPYLKSPEDPENNPGIIEHYQLVQKHDIVTKIAGGSRTYSNSITKNFIFTDEDVPIDGYFRNISAHTEFPGSDYLGKTNKIKTIPSMSPAPIPLKLNEEIKLKK